MSPSVSVRLLLSQSDARLAAFARAGHERAFEALVQRYRRPLHRYCRRLLLSDERAEDALQQALLQAWLALRAGTEVGEVKSWLYRVVHNAAVNALRVSGYDYCKLNESLSGADAPQADLDRRIAVREALAGLAALPEMQREALLRTAVEGRTHQQVARDLGVSENALRGLVYRARTTLRAAAGALTPSPLLSWALGATRGTPVVERLAELGAGGGSAGLAGLLMKGGAVAVTASVLAGGIVAGRHQPKANAKRAIKHAYSASDTTTTDIATASERPARTAAATQRKAVLEAPSQARRSPPHTILFARHPTHSPQRLTPASSPAPSSGVWSGGHHRNGGVGESYTTGSGTRDGAYNSAPGGGTTAPGDTRGEANSGKRAEGVSDRGDAKGTNSTAAGGESHDSTGSPQQDERDREASNSSAGAEADATGSQGGSHDRQTKPDSGSSTGTSTSPKTEQAAVEPAEPD
ncbi:MAG TPA: sigma-70 family RNA polymerase sigma factor [Solirubrobacteraceae bacterium]|jgi:RNA polymerase sigma factor (sigma-70 family)